MSSDGSTNGRNAKLPGIFGLLGGLAFPFLFFFIFSSAPSCMGFQEPTLSAIQACPAAVALLGAPVSQSYVGCSCGNAESSDDFGNASWSFPVTGSTGSGTVDVVAERRGGPWRLLRVTLEAGGQTIDVLGCSPGAGSLSVPRETFHATAATVVGPAPVAQGASCDIELSPGDGPFPCHVLISCGGTIVYGGPSQGFAQCGMTGTGGALHVQDPSASPTDHDAMLDLDLGARQAIVTDQIPAGTWIVTLTF